MGTQPINPTGPQPVQAGPLPVRAGPVPVRAYVPKVPGTAHASKRSAANDDAAPVRNPNPNQSAADLVPVPNPNPSGPQPVRTGPLPVRAGPVPVRAYVPQVPGTAHVSKRSAANDDSAPVRNPNPNQ